MRSVLLSSAMLAALSAAALTPRPAAAQGQATVYVSPSYYYQGYGYSTPYYTGAYNPSNYYYSPTFHPTYAVPYGQPSGYAAPGYPYPVNVIGPAPIYSGPQYFHGYTPSRYWIYP